MTFNNYRNVSLSHVTMDDAIISHKAGGKFISVILDKKLKLNALISYISKKVSESIGILYKLK